MIGFEVSNHLSPRGSGVFGFVSVPPLPPRAPWLSRMTAEIRELLTVVAIGLPPQRYVYTVRL